MPKKYDRNRKPLEPRTLPLKQIFKKRSISKYILALALLVFIYSLALAGNSPDFHDIRTAIDAAHLARSDLLRYSRGTASITLDRQENKPEAAKKFENSASKQLGFSPDAFRTIGKGTWTTKWYQKGSKRRYDIDVSAPFKKDPTRRSFLAEEKMRFAVDPEKSFYYDVRHGHAYINQPPITAYNPLNLRRNFEISRLYNFGPGGLSGILSGLDKLDKSEWQYELAEDQLGQIRCTKLQVKVRRQARYVFWVAPEFSYSVVKGQLFLNKGGVEELAESYEAKYQESASEGIWVLKDVTIETRQGRFRERMEVQLSNTEIGVEIPDETFTFKGLGVPLGTKVYDRSMGGQPLEYYYGSFPMGEVDSLVEEIIDQKAENSPTKPFKENVRQVGKENSIEIGDEESSNDEDGNPYDLNKISAQGLESTNGRGYSWMLYCVFVAGIIVVLSVVLYRTYLFGKRKGTSQ